MASLMGKKVIVLWEAFSTLCWGFSHVGFLTSSELCIVSEALFTPMALSSGANFLGWRGVSIARKLSHTLASTRFPTSTNLLVGDQI